VGTEVSEVYFPSVFRLLILPKMDQHVPPKYWFISTKLHGVISKKTLIVIAITVKTLNVTKLRCFEGKVFLTEY
jgi:hypothetical protein